MMNPIQVVLIDGNAADLQTSRQRILAKLPTAHVRDVGDAAAWATTLASGGFDVVVTEYELAWTDGLQILRQIRERWPECPVLMCTGTSQAEIAVQALATGLHDYVLKSTAGWARLPAAVRIAVELQRQQRTRLAAERRAETVLAGVSDIHLLLDPHWRYQYVNGAAIHAMGRSREEILGRSLWECYPDIHGTELERQYRLAMEQRVPVAFEYHFPATDTWWANRFQPTDLGLAVFASDITARKRAQAQYRQLFDEVTASRARQQRLAARLVEVQEGERRRFARELHDHVGDELTALKLCLQLCRHAPPPALPKFFDEADRHMDELFARVRELALDLRPMLLDDLGLLATVLWHLDRFTSQTGVHVEFEHTGVEARRFRPELETAAYRIIQEALTNVARHAGVRHATARLWADDQRLGVQIKDHGAGFDLALTGAGAGAFGLTGMEERARLLGGDWTIETAPGLGTCLTAEIPLINDTGCV